MIGKIYRKYSHSTQVPKCPYGQVNLCKGIKIPHVDDLIRHVSTVLQRRLDPENARYEQSKISTART
jgi:hypothetical protein